MADGHQWFRLCVVAAQVDREVVEEERALLRRLAWKLGLTEEEAATVFRSVLGSQRIELPDVPTDQARELLQLVVRVTGADHILKPAERVLVERLGARFGLTTVEVARLIDTAF